MYDYVRVKKSRNRFVARDSSVVASLRAADRVLGRIYGRVRRRARAVY